MYTSTPSSSSLPQLCKALIFSPSTHQPNSLFPQKQHKPIKTHVLDHEKIVKIEALKGSGFKTFKTHFLNHEKIAKIEALKGSGFKTIKTHGLNSEKIVKIQALKGSDSKTIKTHVLNSEKIVKVEALKGSGFETIKTNVLNNERVVKVEALKGSGFLSAIGTAIEEEEEYRKARAEVKRKSADLGGYSVEGLSVGGHETCVIVPELKSAFDIGRCPPRAVQQNFLFITHAHLDHIGGLPMYLATRGLYNLKPPTVFVPPCIKEDVEKLIDIHRVLGQVELNVELVALDIGETYEMRNDLVVRPFKTHHVIPSQGYVVYSVRKKLKKQYIHLNGKQIEKLKKSGVEITDTILSPEVAFTGDTTSDFFLDPRSADALRANILITEATFLNEDYSVEHAREHGHTHIFEIMAHAKWIRNKTLLLTHFSSRYHIEDIRQAVSQLQSKVSAKVIPLTEGFKSKHT